MLKLHPIRFLHFWMNPCIGAIPSSNQECTIKTKDKLISD